MKPAVAAGAVVRRDDRIFSKERPVASKKTATYEEF